jgi:ADP-ribosylglycohydrolase
MRPIEYPEHRTGLEGEVALWAQLAAEQRSPGVDSILAEAGEALRNARLALEALVRESEPAGHEPDDLDAIRAARPTDRRTVSSSEIDRGELRRRLLGALIGRCAGCTLGAPVELRPVDEIEAWAAHIGQDFPPTDYWSTVERPHERAYRVSYRREFTPTHMHGAPTDDDIVYTQLGLLILEEHGPEFTTEDVGEAWKRFVPFAHTAERIALKNLHEGVPAARAAEVDNPYRQMIGAGIRADPWGYASAGMPERAATLAHRDASLSHRRNGIYAAMFFAAAIAAAVTVEDPVDALEIGLGEIPADSLLADGVRWALDLAPAISDHRDAHAAVAERYSGMHMVHSINNACLTIFGLAIGRRDLTRVIGETVAMGLDNDCNAATAGSIAGAVVGIDEIAERWWKPLDNRAFSYLNDHREFRLDDMVERFIVQRDRWTR